MFTETSRYYSLETVKYTNSEGREVVYKRRRFLPVVQRDVPYAEVTVTEGDRLDVITYKTLGDAEHFWLICDANNAMNPVELTEEIGCKLRVMLPLVPGANGETA